ncbi:MAG TPA: response regulator [Bryobacteraceae bacterium]|jgi:FixJ family two-component response regulator
MWRFLQSLFTDGSGNRAALSSRASSAGTLAPGTASPGIPVVAMVVNQPDRNVLTAVGTQEPFAIRFAESYEEACSLARQLSAPVILVDRDWPGSDWRGAVETFAALPHAACVILVSGVADDYLWQELIRRGGYDVLGKPLRREDVARVLKLALSYWQASTNPAVPLTR